MEKEKEKEEPKKEDKKEEDKAVSIVEEARSIRDEIVKARDELKEQNKIQQNLQAEAMLSGSGGGHVEVKPPKKLTDIQYAEAYERGEVNPMSKDGHA